MRDLREVYKGKVFFEVLPAAGEAGKAAVMRNGWADALHGLETLAPDGRVVGNLPGHDYGREEIVVQVEALLKQTSR